MHEFVGVLAGIASNGRGGTVARTLALGMTLAVVITAGDASADKVWLESDRTIVKHFTVTPGYPNNQSCLFKMTTLTDKDGSTATFGFSLLQFAPLSPFSYTDKAAQWFNEELIQLQVDGNKAIINQARIDEYRGLSGLMIIPSSRLAEQMSRGRTLTVTTRAGTRIISIPTEAVKAFQQCASALPKKKYPWRLTSII